MTEEKKFCSTLRLKNRYFILLYPILSQGIILLYGQSKPKYTLIGYMRSKNKMYKQQKQNVQATKTIVKTKCMSNKKECMNNNKKCICSKKKGT